MSATTPADRITGIMKLEKYLLGCATTHGCKSAFQLEGSKLELAASEWLLLKPTLQVGLGT